MNHWRSRSTSEISATGTFSSLAARRVIWSKAASAGVSSSSYRWSIASRSSSWAGIGARGFAVAGVISVFILLPALSSSSNSGTDPADKSIEAPMTMVQCGMETIVGLQATCRPSYR
ncbi:hypothetical protein ACHMW5_09520 [Azospirillum melinis]|uniref:hypothetical protein n=1 Tax=Azospirillum melinis TaxID=328839 RepID=UPI00375743E5